MFFDLQFQGRSIGVSEETFYSVLQEFETVGDVVAMVDRDGCYYYHFWSTLNEWTYIGCSSELFKEGLYEG